MKYHILNGDVLHEQLKQTTLKGEFYVVRECLIDGEVNSKTLDNFWGMRANFLTKNYGISTDEYMEKTRKEFEAIAQIPDNSSIYLWFERDLFCQINLWFTLYFIRERLGTKNHYLFLVLPNHQEWTGFGNMSSEELMRTFEQKIQLRQDDIQLFTDLWQAFIHNDLETLRQQSLLVKNRYPYLPDVIQAHIERYPKQGELSRPERAIQKIIREIKSNDFASAFKIFTQREGIYGYGDLQFKQLYEKHFKRKSTS